MTSKRESWGDYYGYPKCCIRSFHSMLRKNILFHQISDVRKNATKNGFIPCAACAKKIVAGTITIEELISPNRQCPTPFTRGF